MKNKSLVYECASEVSIDDNAKNIKITEIKSEIKGGYCKVIIVICANNNHNLDLILKFFESILNSNAHSNQVVFNDILKLFENPVECELINLNEYDYKPSKMLIANISDSLELANFFIFVATNQIPQALVYANANQKEPSFILRSVD